MKLVRLFALVWGVLSFTHSASAQADDYSLPTAAYDAEYVELDLDTDAAAGACTAEDRSKYIYAGNLQFADATASCGRAAFGAAGRTAQCLVKSFAGLTAPCAKCFGNMANCAATKCYNQCAASSTNPACIQCVRNTCTPGLVSCTGVAAEDLPKR